MRVNYNVYKRAAHSLIHVEILRKVVFYGWDDGLDKLQEQYKVHVDVQITPTIFDNLDKSFHYISVSEMK